MKGRHLLLLLTSVTLTGCSLPINNDLNSKKAEVNEYNELVEDTVSAYVDVNVFIESNKSDMMNYILSDKVWSLISDVDKPSKLTSEELEAFKVKGIIYDKYFTSLGADTVREVLVISGNGYNMYVTIIWGKDNIHSLSRVVTKL